MHAPWPTYSRPTWRCLMAKYKIPYDSYRSAAKDCKILRAFDGEDSLLTIANRTGLNIYAVQRTVNSMLEVNVLVRVRHGIYKLQEI